MPNVPFPKGIVGLQAFPKQQEWLKNFLLTQEGVIRTPGIEAFTVGSGVCRGASQWRDGYDYQVSGNDLIRINSVGSITVLGTIAGSADCVFSPGQTNLVIVVKGGNGYRYNDTDGLVQITDPDYIPSVSVDFIDGRHVFVPYDGEPAFYSSVDSPGDISPLSFFDAEELPDKNRAVINVQNQLIILGDDSFEVFRTNIDPDVVFTRREGARVDVGYIAGLTRFAGTFAFLGRSREQTARFFVAGAGTAEPISTPAIDEILNDDYTAAEREECEGMRYEWKGTEVLVFTLPRHTFKFANGIWSYADSDLDGTNAGQWRARWISCGAGRYVVGDREGSNIGILSNEPSEYGDRLEAELQTYVRDERNSYIDITKLELDCLTGQAITNKTVGISVSRDARIWSDYHYRTLGLIGKYSQRVLWQPIGQCENYLGIRIRTTADVSFSLEALTAE